MAKPNILWIISDQHRADAMGFAGNAHLHTPNLDRLAREGTAFNRAYCADPLCVPSRASMMIGKMPHEVATTINLYPKTDHITRPMAGRLLADAGYDCCYVGKWHLPVPTGQVETHGFDTLRAVSHAAADEQKDSHIPPACQDLLRQPRSRPFFMVASFTNPHDICQWGRGQTLPNGAIAETPDLRACPPLPDNFDIPEHEPDILRELQARDPGIYPSANWDAARWRQYLWAYYRLVELTDRRVGQVLDALDRTGHDNDTLVIFTSDHGEAAGAHRWTQKSVLYEEAVRVPLIMRWPGSFPAGAIDDTNIVSTGLDLVPTLCDVAGALIPHDISGVSLRQATGQKQSFQARDYVVTETEFSGGFESSHGVRGRMLRSARYKYVVYSHGTQREQLFDMLDDPGEMVNLAADTAFAPILNQHRTWLCRWCATTADDFPTVNRP